MSLYIVICTVRERIIEFFVQEKQASLSLYLGMYNKLKIDRFITLSGFVQCDRLDILKLTI